MQQVASAGLSFASAETVSSTSGELADFDHLVEMYWPKVFRFALASLHDADLAGTIAQDCLLHAHRGAAGFRGASSVGTWIMRIAVNLIRDHARSRRLQFWKRTRECATDWDDVNRRISDGSARPERRAIARDQVRAIWDATVRLPHRQRTVFLLRFVEEMDLAEIALATGLREGTVKAHLFRALETVRKQVREVR